LPLPVRKLADANYELLKRDPRHPSLQFKKVGRYWSVRNGLRYRALAVEVDHGYLWFWIGSHADYDARRMGGAKRYPSTAVCEDDGFREGLNPSYLLIPDYRRAQEIA
jgi:hypothetical protein